MFGAGQDEAEKRDEMIAKAQSDEHDDELNYPLFYWVKNRDLSQVKRVLKEFKRATPVYVSVDGTFDGKEEQILADKAEILKRDAAGATVLHIAYLFEEFEIARYLVEQYPSEALLPYDGECILFDSDTGKIRLVVEKKGDTYTRSHIIISSHYFFALSLSHTIITLISHPQLIFIAYNQTCCIVEKISCTLRSSSETSLKHDGCSSSIATRYRSQIK